MTWHVVAQTHQVGEGQVLGLSVEKTLLAVYNIGGQFYATSNVCTHAFALMSDGYLDGDCIECPIHQAVFHVPTGERRAGPTRKPLATFPIKQDGADILVDVPIEAAGQVA